MAQEKQTPIVGIKTRQSTRQNNANHRNKSSPIVGKVLEDCKTTTAEQIAESILYMDDPEKKEQNIAMSELNPKRLLEGATPRLIDEWQLAPKLWDAIRFEVDHRRELLVEEGVESLKTMQAKIDTGKMKAPSFLMVLTGTGDYAYCRRDGVYVVPIGCLKN